MLNLQDLRECLNPNLDQKRRERFEIAFRSLGYQEDYCRYHYDQFHKEHDFFKAVFFDKLEGDEIHNSHHYRIAFEAHCFAFFRAFHALIESIPYLLNIMLEIKEDSEFRYLSWNTVKQFCTKDIIRLKIIEELLESTSYGELTHIVNVSKHRRIVRIDSGVFSSSSKPKFWKGDLDETLSFYEIDLLMKKIFDELHPKAINVIKGFMDNWKGDKHS